ncbi:hypothetical protein [Lichenicola sp.]|uniref:hypothetical protein n=1 Tax=Lichenicola sp. TaxID=2804529 RepID=UPI003AFFE308
MGDMVIVAFRAKSGCEPALLQLVRDHVPTLRRLGLATTRPALAMTGRDGVVIEVFAWQPGGIAIAHTHSEILAMWQRFEAVSDHASLRELPETAELFAQFVPIDL